MANTPVHSVRIDNTVWDAAKARATKEEDLSMNAILSRYVAGYANGAATPPAIAEYDGVLLQHSKPRK